MKGDKSDKAEKTVEKAADKVEKDVAKEAEAPVANKKGTLKESKVNTVVLNFEFFFLFVVFVFVLFFCFVFCFLIFF